MIYEVVCPVCGRQPIAWATDLSFTKRETRYTCGCGCEWVHPPRLSVVRATAPNATVVNVSSTINLPADCDFATFSKMLQDRDDNIKREIEKALGK